MATVSNNDPNSTPPSTGQRNPAIAGPRTPSQPPEAVAAEAAAIYPDTIHAATNSGRNRGGGVR